MISPMYTALGSVCRTHSRLPRYTHLVAQGDFLGARKLANEAKLRCTDAFSESCMAQAAADMSILLGEYEQAETLYAGAVSALTGSPHLNAVSCRATGIQALFQHRFDVATHCFRRNAEETVSVEFRLESYAILALIYREVGLDKSAYENCFKLRNLAEQTSRQNWRDVSMLVALDLAAYREIYASSAMSDHIFRHMKGAVIEVVDTPLIGEHADNWALDPEMAPLVLARKQHLMHMVHLASGKKLAWEEIEKFSHAQFAKNSNLYLKYGYLEIGLAAIAGGNYDIAEQLMSNESWMEAHRDLKAKNTVRIDQNEWLFFFAKMQKKSAAIDENSAFYQLYLERSFKAIHQFTNKLQQIISNGLVNAGALPLSLEVSARLAQPSEQIPVRCQRAYDYIQENSWRSDVSVREVASIIGVSERWLQLQFKRHYGCSPKTVIRDRHQVAFS